MKRDPNYYNEESQKYSQRRYIGEPETHNQYYFQARRRLVLKLLSKLVINKKGLSLLDIACADGVLTRAVDDYFPGVFSRFVGTDVAPLMIKVARQNFLNESRFSFYIKDDCPLEQFDIVFGLGYLTTSILDDEMNFLNMRIKPGGYYLCTLASNNSLFVKFKSRSVDFESGYKTYPEYRVILKKNFEIIEEVPNGLLIPKLWTIPSLAKFVQPLFESVFSYVFPNLFQEKIYLLRKK